jgi:hypothetical protein
VIEVAVRGVGDLDDAEALQRHGHLTSLHRRERSNPLIGRMEIPFTCNLLENSIAAQILERFWPSGGEPVFPRSIP